MNRAGNRAKRATISCALLSRRKLIGTAAPIALAPSFRLTFASVAVAGSSHIPVAIQRFSTAGYAQHGDGGGAAYERVGAEPDHPGKLRSGDGSWWEIRSDPITPLMFGAMRDLDNQSRFAQLAATTAKARRAELRFPACSDLHDCYRLSSVDIGGLRVTADPVVRFLPPVDSTAHAFVALGTASNRILAGTHLSGIQHDGLGIALGLFTASFADGVVVDQCSGRNYPHDTLNHRDAQVIALTECRHPIVQNSQFHGGRTGVQFNSCLSPTARGVHTMNQGRDGIAFYTEPNGSLTTSALAYECRAERWCLNNEGGRAGIHFYGVRGAMAISCSAHDDSGQVHDDTGGIRFRDCEDFVCDRYEISGCLTGLLVNEIGDYRHRGITVRGSVKRGKVSQFRKYGIFITPHIACDIIGATVRGTRETPGSIGIYNQSKGRTTASINCTMGPAIYTSNDQILIVKVKNCGYRAQYPAIEIAAGHAVLENCLLYFTDSHFPTVAIATGRAARVSVVRQRTVREGAAR